AAQGETRRLRVRGSLAQSADDRLQLRDRAVAEKRQGDVQVPARDGPEAGHVRKRLALPGDDCVHRGRRQLESQEEPYPLIAFDASRTPHAPLSRICAKSARARWSAAAVARARTAARSPPRSSSLARPLRGPSPCR